VNVPESLKPSNREEERLLQELDADRLPQHIAVIMDGNGRWAKKRHLPRVMGHRAGVQSARTIVETCARLHIPALTLYAFSMENWRRPKAEIDFLMRLLREYLRKELPVIHRNNIRLLVIGRADQLPDADLVVAGDGVNSALREPHVEHFGSDVTLGRNTYVWLGTTKVFDSFTFSFVETEHGWIWCYAYPFSGEHSTCVVECSPETWTGLGLDTANEGEGLPLLEKLFADLLDGHALIGRVQSDGSAQWLNFRTLTNRTWHRGNLVLIGDAAHTTHYSIGAGTTLALEDALSLAGALREIPDLGAALAHYERERKAELLSIQSAARHSAQWYENLPRYIHLPPAQMFALLGQRHSPLLPYIPPQVYYRIDRAAGQLEALRRFKRWLGPRLARTVQAARSRG